jgi:hypothetical protein
VTAPRRRKASVVTTPWSCGDEENLSVECSVEPFVPARTYGPPERCHEAEGGDVTILAVYDEDGKERPDLLDAAERDRARIEADAFEEAEESHAAAYEAAEEDRADAAREAGWER